MRGSPACRPTSRAAPPARRTSTACATSSPARGIDSCRRGFKVGPMTDQGLAAWKLPLIVAAICVSIVGAFYVGGPGMGMAEGSLVAGIIVVMAVRHPPLHPIVPPPPSDLREHLLVVVEEPLENGTAIERIAAASAPLDPADPEPEVRVVKIGTPVTR